MRNKVFILLGLLMAAFLVVGAVQAFTIGNIDGVWDLINGSTAGATGQAWASGPAAGNTNFDTPGSNITTSASARTGTQNAVLYDWNQVRYGNTSFGDKSGFGFLGTQSVGDTPELDVNFNLGQFCHFNNTISASTPLNYVDLVVSVSGITCDAPFVYDGPDPLEFKYVFNLDETTNSVNFCLNYGSGDCLCRTGSGILDSYTRCKYGPGSTGWPTNGGSYCPHRTGTLLNPVLTQAHNGIHPQSGDLNYNGCADLVNITKSSGSASFLCRDNANDITKEYTVSLMGFVDIPASGECEPTLPAGTAFHQNQVYTAENTNNCYCVYGAITHEDVTPVILLDFQVQETEDGNLLTWQTATEVNHLGFNVLRANTEFGVKEKINSALVVGDSNPGNPFGGHYFFLDENAEPGVTYYYWIEDVPSDTSYTPELFGPVTATRP